MKRNKKLDIDIWNGLIIEPTIYIEDKTYTDHKNGTYPIFMAHLESVETPGSKVPNDNWEDGLAPVYWACGKCLDAGMKLPAVGDE